MLTIPTFKNIPRRVRLVMPWMLVSAGISAQLEFSETNVDLGRVGAVYEVAGDLVVRNGGDAKVHVLRATSDKGLRVYISKRTLLPGDTALLVISYLPEEAGRFSKAVTLLTTDQKGSHTLRLSGQIDQVKENDLTACYYFGSRARRAPRQPTLYTSDTPAARPPDRPANPLRAIPRPLATNTPAPPPPRGELPPTPVEQGPLAGHLPNNILILLDVSSSMRDSLKLPLLKSEMHKLIDAIREVDSITLVTYADSVMVRAEALSGSEKEQLHTIVDALKARGQTKGKKAILRSQEISQRHYIKGGNNLLVLASDGKFKFTEEDQAVWDARQANGAITISTVAFGDDREAVSTLRRIAKRGSGSFIHIRKRERGDRLLEEIRERSRI